MHTDAIFGGLVLLMGLSVIFEFLLSIIRRLRKKLAFDGHGPKAETAGSHESIWHSMKESWRKGFKEGYDWTTSR